MHFLHKNNTNTKVFYSIIFYALHTFSIKCWNAYFLDMNVLFYIDENTLKYVSVLLLLDMYKHTYIVYIV